MRVSKFASFGVDLKFESYWLCPAEIKMKGGGKDSKTQQMNQGKAIDQKKKQLLWNMELESISQTAKEHS